MAARSRSSIGTVYLTARISAAGTVADLGKQLDRAMSGVSKTLSENINRITEPLGAVAGEISKSAKEINSLKLPDMSKLQVPVPEVPKKTIPDTTPLTRRQIREQERAAEKSARSWRNALRGVDWKAGASAAGSALDSALTSAGNKFNKRFKRLALGTAASIGGAITGALAVSLKKGWDRAVNIDTAQAKLRGLGHDTGTVSQIMDDALASVSGTAYGLADAVTVSATAVAAGVKPGKDLEKYLTLIADGSTIAGTSLSEMGAILNKVSIGNKLYAAELNQLQDRGLPITTWLMEDLGLTMDALQEKMRAGEVSFKDLSRVMEKNLGGAAKSSGDTIQGSIENVGAAMGRFGAILWTSSGALSLIQPINTELMSMFDVLSKRIGPALEKFSEKWVPKLSSRIDGMGEKLGNLLTDFLEGEGALSDLRATWEGEWKDPLADAWNAGKDVFIQYIDIMRDFLPVIQELGRLVRENPETVGKMVAWGLVLNQVFGFLGSAWMSVRPLVTGIIRFAPWLGRLAGIAVRFAGPIGFAIGLVWALVEAIRNWGSISEALSTAWEWMNPQNWFDPETAVGEWLSNVGNSISEWGKNLFANVGEWFDPIHEWFSNALSGLGDVIWMVLGPILRVLRSFWNIIWRIWTGIAKFWIGVVTPIFNVVKNLVSWAVGMFVRAWTKLKSTVVSVWNGVSETVRGILSSIIEWFDSTFGEAFRNIRDGVVEFGQSLVDAFGPVFQEIGSWFGSLWQVLSDAWDWIAEFFGNAEEKVDGFMQGIENIGKGIGDFFKGLINGLIGFINSGIRGINGVIEGMNSALSLTLPDWMGGHSFSLDIPPVPEIPALAKGALVTGPTVALVGEAGNEYVVDEGKMNALIDTTTRRMDSDSSSAAPIVKVSIGQIVQNPGEDGPDFARRVAQAVADAAAWDTRRRDAW